MDRDVFWFVVSVVVVVIAAFSLGYIGGQSNVRYDYQDEAVERGYAEFVPAEDPRAKPVFQWIEMEVE